MEQENALVEALVKDFNFDQHDARHREGQQQMRWLL
jgi:hypothetical protein